MLTGLDSNSGRIVCVNTIVTTYAYRAYLYRPVFPLFYDNLNHVYVFSFPEDRQPLL